MLDPFKQHSNVNTAYFRSGKINAVILALLIKGIVVAIVIATTED